MVVTVGAPGGYGDGFGVGYGSGYGDGSGYGSGFGFGFGDGYGSGFSYFAALLSTYADHPTLTNLDADATLGIWRSDRHAKPANGGRADPVKVGDVQEVDGPLRVCTDRALHASLEPGEWSGERWWVVALLGPVQWQGNKVGGLRRLIVAELGTAPK